MCQRSIASSGAMIDAIVGLCKHRKEKKHRPSRAVHSVSRIWELLAIAPCQSLDTHRRTITINVSPWIAWRPAREFFECVGGINGSVQPCPKYSKATGINARFEVHWLGCQPRRKRQSRESWHGYAKPRSISIWHFGVYNRPERSARRSQQ